MEMMRFQSYYFQLINSIPVLFISWNFSFCRKFVSKLKYWKRSKFSLIVTEKHAHLSKGVLFWKFLVPFFRKTYALFVSFKKKTLIKRVSSVKTKAYSNFAVKTCWKEQPFIFTVYLMNHLFQTSVPFNIW